MASWIGPAIAAGGQLVGGLLGQNASDNANASRTAAWRQNNELQLEFAKKGIQWKVADAKAAGIHPLYALGASGPTFNPSPISIQAGSPMGDALGKAGQNIDRAVEAAMTKEDRHTARLQELQIERGELENALIRAQLAAARVMPNPPMQGTADVSGDALGFSGDVPMDNAGRRMEPTTRTKDKAYPFMGAADVPDTEAAENRYGDVAGEGFGLYTLARDLWSAYKDDVVSSGSRTVLDFVEWLARNGFVPEEIPSRTPGGAGW